MHLQLTTIFTLLTVSASVASAWVFIGYVRPNFEGAEVIYQVGDDSKLNENLCFDISPTHDNQMSSFAWFSGPDGPVCTFKLYNGTKCKGNVLEQSDAAELIRPNMGQVDDQASSLGVNCVPA